MNQKLAGLFGIWNFGPAKNSSFLAGNTLVTLAIVHRNGPIGIWCVVCCAAERIILKRFLVCIVGVHLVPTSKVLSGIELCDRTYCKTEAKKAGLRPEGDDLKKIMADVIPHIRFPCLTATEMALTVTPARLLTAEQELQLYTHIGKVSGKKPAEIKDEPKKGAKKEHPRVAGFISVARKPFGILRAVTSRFEDNTGIFWYIGTDDGKRGYVNPIESDVGCRMSTLVGSLPSLADRNYTSTPVENTYGSDAAPWIEYEFRRWKVRPTHYFLAQEQDHYLRNWRIEGSDDGSSWTTLREHTNDSTIHSSNRWAFFDLKADKFYRRLKLQMTGPSHNGSTNMDVTEMEWYGYITPV